MGKEESGGEVVDFEAWKRTRDREREVVERTKEVIIAHLQEIGFLENPKDPGTGAGTYTDDPDDVA